MHWAADALAAEDEATQKIVTCARWLLGATGPDELPALDIAIYAAATSGGLSDLADQLARRLDENLVTTVALLLD